MKSPHFLAATLLLATSPAFNIFYTGTNDQQWSLVACVTFGYIIYALKQKQLGLSIAALNKICMLITAYICIYTYSYYFINPTSLIGPFENPNVLSIHLCLLLPFVHNYAQGLNGQKKHFIQIIELVSIITIILTMCRAGWICLIIFATCCIAKGKWKILSISFFIPIAILLGTNFKQGSTQGRSFILHNTIDIIKEAPFLGHGINGFDTQYMPRQASYFITHHDEQLEMLASDIHHPLNEFLLWGVNFGIVGILILLAILFIPIIWRKRLYQQNRPLWTCLCMLIIFCLFSYPLSYPLPWIFVLLSWVEILKPQIEKFIAHCRKICVISTLLLLIISFGYTAMSLTWGYASREAKENKRSAEMMPIYKMLYPYLSWRGVFLYDFAIESFYAHRDKQAYFLAEKCRECYVSYDLSLLQGDICRYMKKHDEALIHYDEASYMCPVRFAPLYEKWKVYVDIGETLQARTLADTIMHKEIKIYSQEITKMITEIKEYYDKEK